LSRGFYEATFGTQVLGEHLPWRPDVVLAVVPSLAGAYAASVIARRRRAHFVVWVQDLMGPAVEQSGIHGRGWVANVTRHIEGRVLRRADRVLVLNEAFKAYALDVGVESDKIEIAPNWSHVSPPYANREDTRKALGWHPSDIVALHSGNMGLKQGLENIIDAARLAPAHSKRLRFVLMGDGNQRATLVAYGQGVEALQFLPPADSAHFTNVLAAADVLLVNERASALDMSLPSKLTSYFTVGVPVVAAVPDGGTAHEVNRSGGGVVVPPEDPTRLVREILRLVVDGGHAQEIGRKGQEYALMHLGPRATLDRISRILVANL
jgi:glycosyltransferase involved in cell wall biosynthesis